MRFPLYALSISLMVLPALGGEKTAVPVPRGLVAEDVVVEAAATVCFLEGPAVDAEGNVFSATSPAIASSR